MNGKVMAPDKQKKRLNRYQVMMRAAVILGLLFFILLSFGLEMIFSSQ